MNAFIFKLNYFYIKSMNINDITRNCLGVLCLSQNAIAGMGFFANVRIHCNLRVTVFRNGKIRSILAERAGNGSRRNGSIIADSWDLFEYGGFRGYLAVDRPDLDLFLLGICR